MQHLRTKKLALSDLISLSRATSAGILAGLTTAGIRDREGIAGRIAWLLAIWGLISDIMDGRVARRLGETKLSSVLDIEADSWLTLWSAAGAISLGGLPRWCILPPLLRYVHPILDLLRGDLPVGGGPWWGRLTGGSQTALFLYALAPIPQRTRRHLLRIAWLPVSAGQILSMSLLFFHHRKSSANTPTGHGRQVALQ